MRSSWVIIVPAVLFVFGCGKGGDFDVAEFNRLAMDGQELIILCFQARDPGFVYERIKQFENELDAFEKGLSNTDQQRKEVQSLRSGIGHLKTATFLKMGASKYTPNIHLDELWKASEDFWRALGTPDSTLDQLRTEWKGVIR